MIKTICAALMLSLILFSTTVYAQDMIPRIINGVDAPTGTWPYMVSIHFPYTSGGHGCGGTLVAPNWVLTAAHCVDGEVAEDIFVYTGLYQQSDLSPASLIPVERFIQHPQYDPDEIINDVALLELSFNALEEPVVLNAGGSMPDDSFALGWGLTSVEGENSDKLQYLDLPLVSNQTCNSVYQSMEITIDDSQICAGYIEGGKDTCQNDSGGPLLINTSTGVQQVGVVSFGASPDGAPCAGVGSYGVYSRVSSFLDFIQQYVPSIQTAEVGTSAGETSEATLSSDLTLTVPSLLWSSPDEIPLYAILKFIPGSDISFEITNYGEIAVQQDYVANLSSSLELSLPHVTLWDNSDIWVEMYFDTSYQDKLVFSVDSFGYN